MAMVPLSRRKLVVVDQVDIVYIAFVEAEDDPPVAGKDNRDACSPALKSVAGNRAPGFSSLLGLLFIGLKLAGHINWSWWWVLSPFWIMGGLALVVVVGILIVEKRTGWDLFSGET